MTPGTPCSSVSISTVPGGGDDRPTKTGQFGPDYAEKRRRMGQVAAFVALTVRRKMEIMPEQQGRPIAAATQHPMSDLTIPPVFAVSNPATEAEDDPGRSTSETSDSQFTI